MTAAQRATALDRYVDEVVERAGELTAEQLERIRTLLAPVEEVPDARAS